MSNPVSDEVSVEIKRLATAILVARQVVLTTHESPDGDGLGAELAMREGLMGLGKSVTILNDSPIPSEYRFLDEHEVIQSFSPEEHLDLLLSADMVILLDARAPERTGRLQTFLEVFGGVTAVIDHHAGRTWGDIAVVETSACATTLLVRSLLAECHTPLTKTLAQSLYLGLLVDTMSFRNANTTAGCLRLASELVTAGATPSELWRKVFGEQPLNRLRLEGDFLSCLRTLAAGRLVWGAISARQLAHRSQAESAIEGFVERAMDTAEAEIAILFVERPTGVIRVSLRSRALAVDGLARDLGGDGHRLAAGALVSGSLSTVARSVLRQARDLLADRA